MSTLSLTVDTLARARGLDPNLLRRLGWRDAPEGVAIPWPTSSGAPALHVRRRLEKPGDGPRWVWRNHNHATLLPYGADRLATMRQKAPEIIVISESEIDAMGLWSAGIPAIASGGADGWRADWWGLLDGFQRVVLWLEDGGTLHLLRKLVSTRPEDGPTLYTCHGLGGPKDAGRILASLNGTGRNMLRQIVDRAVAVRAVRGANEGLLATIVELLGARRSGQAYEAHCPFHADHDPSLSIFQGEKEWCFKCHSGRCGAAGPLGLLGAALGVVAEAAKAAKVAEGAEGAEVASHSARPQHLRPAQEDIDDWPEERSYPWPTLAVEALHGLAGDVVRTIDPVTEADPVAVLLSFLSGFGAALGPGAYCQVGLERHPLRIWAVLVGATAKGRKGSSLAPVRAILEHADPDFVQSRILSGLSTGEGVIWAVRDPLYGREKVKDSGETCYQEVLTDPGVEDKRLWVVEEELSSVLKVLAREGNTLSATLRQAWDRGDLRILTKNSPARATGAHITVLGHAVGDEVRRYLVESEMAGGFGNRFLWACVRRSKVLPRGAILDPSAIEHLGRRVRQALDYGRAAGLVGWGDEAGRQWDAVYPGLSEGKPGMFGAMVARMEAQALRLAGLYAVLDRTNTIQPQHLQAALAVVSYCEASTRWIFGDSLGDPVADAILQALRRQGELSRSAVCDIMGRHVPRQRIQRALRLLQQWGLAECEKQETGGRPSEVWRVVGP